MTARLTVVVPVYNVEQYLEECLRSIAAQTMGDLDVVMVDDGSTDASADLARAFAAADPRFRLVSQDNGGLGHARNTGARHADPATPYLTFVDSDDVLPPRAYEQLTGLLDRSGSDFATGNVYRLTAAGRSQGGQHRGMTRTVSRTHVTRDLSLLSDRVAWNKVFRRDFWDRHALAFPEGVLYEDTPLTIPAHFLADAVDVLKDHVYYWRIREGSITRRRTDVKGVTDRIAAVDGVSRFLGDPANARWNRFKRHYDRSVLTDDLVYFIEVLPMAGPDYRRVFMDRCQDFMSRVDPAVWPGLPVELRMRWELVREGRLDDLLDVLAHERHGGRAVFDLVGPPLRKRAEVVRPDGSPVPLSRAATSLGRGDLPVVAQLRDLRWRHGKLVLRGFAYVRNADVRGRRSALTTAVAVCGRRRLLLPLRTVRAQEVTDALAQERHCYDWSGFEITVDPRRLRTDGAWKPAQWRIGVLLAGPAGVRPAALRAAEAGAGSSPVPFPLDGDTRLVPWYKDGRLHLSVEPVTRRLTGHHPAGEDALRLDLEVRDRTLPVSLRLTRQAGHPTVERPLQPAPHRDDAAPGWTPLTAELPLADIAAGRPSMAGLPKEVPPETTATWTAELVFPDGATARVSLDRDLPPGRYPLPDDTRVPDTGQDGPKDERPAADPAQAADGTPAQGPGSGPADARGTDSAPADAPAGAAGDPAQSPDDSLGNDPAPSTDGGPAQAPGSGPADARGTDSAPADAPAGAAGDPAQSPDDSLGNDPAPSTDGGPAQAPGSGPADARGTDSAPADAPAGAAGDPAQGPDDSLGNDPAPSTDGGPAQAPGSGPADKRGTDSAPATDPAQAADGTPAQGPGGGPADGRGPAGDPAPSAQSTAAPADSAGLSSVRARELCVEGTAAGNLVVRDRVPHAVADEVGLTPDGRLLVGGELPAGAADPVRMVLRHGRYGAEIGAGVERGPADRFSASVDVGALPHEGRWYLQLRTAGGRDVPVRIAPRAMPALPMELATAEGERPVTLDRRFHDHLFVAAGSAVPAPDRGPYRQRMLRERRYPVLLRRAFTPTVLYSSFDGLRCDDSPRAVHDEMVRRGEDFAHVWVVADRSVPVPAAARAVVRGSHAWYEALARSRCVVTNTHLPAFFRRREGQHVLQTGLGTPVKRFGQDLAGTLCADLVHMWPQPMRGDQWTVLLSPNAQSTPVLRRALAFTGEVAETGLPRNDLLSGEDRDKIAEDVRARLGLPPDRTVVLYAPTVRDDESYDADHHRLRLTADLAELEAALGGTHVVLLRAHPLVADTVRTPDSGFVRDVTRHQDLAELLLAADVLVTDYSSLLADFAVTAKPVLLQTPDLAHMRDTLRGFTFDIEAQAPGPLLSTTAELVDALRDPAAAVRPYGAAYDAFRAAFCHLDDGGAAARVADLILRGPRI